MTNDAHTRAERAMAQHAEDIAAARAAGKEIGRRLARTPLTDRQRATIAGLMGGKQPPRVDKEQESTESTIHGGDREGN